jgi:catalase
VFKPPLSPPNITQISTPPPTHPPQFTFLLDDIGVPLNYRHMEGFGVHTFKLVNAGGKETLVKFHWKPKCGELDPGLTGV